jgi:putative intracellular protease/amidase
MAKVVFPLPDRDFDPTETAIPWRVLTGAGHEVQFATAEGATPAADPRLLEGVLFGQLGAEPPAKKAYAAMTSDAAFRAPLTYRALVPGAFDGLWLAGGHAKGMRPYLEDEPLRAFVRSFWELGRPVAAICHGVLVLARAGVLSGVRTTCLPRYMEQAAWMATAWRLGDYYRTYPEWVQSEVVRRGARFERGPIHLFAKGTEQDDRDAFIVEEGRYLSGRWPGDAWLLARRFAACLPSPPTDPSPTPS